MVWTGSQLALVHIGDSRAYLLRDGELFRITHDHTLVQSMIDEGRLTQEEAASHPDRALLLRASSRKVRVTRRTSGSSTPARGPLPASARTACPGGRPRRPPRRPGHHRRPTPPHAV